MKDFYRENHSKYFERTFNIDPSSFLLPPATKLAPGAFIVDVGCGSGRDLLWLKNRGFSVTGFERSPELAGLFFIFFSMKSWKPSLLHSVSGFSISPGIPPKREPARYGSGICLKKNEPAGSPAHYSSFPGVRRFEVANRDLKNDDVLSLFKIGKQSLYIKI